MKFFITGKAHVILIILLLPIASFGYDETSQELTPRQLRNLTAFSKLYGYLRFFNPTDAALKADWDWYTIEGIKAIENSVSDKELIANLEQWGKRLAPLMTINKSPNKPEGTSTKIRYWWHRGFGGYGFKGTLHIFNPYSSRIKKTNITQLAEEDYFIPSPDSIFSFALADGITVHMPVSLYVKAGKSLPENNLKIKSSDKQAYTADNRSTRLAIVIVGWNILRHFYPYWDVANVDWDETLQKVLFKASADKNTQEEYGATLLMLVENAKDGHGAFFYSPKSSAERKNFYPNEYGMMPIKLQWVQGNVVISDCNNCDSIQVTRGDIVKSINGVDILNIVADKEKICPAATDNLRKRLAMIFILTVPKDSIYNFIITDSIGNSYNKAIIPVAWYTPKSKRPTTLTEIAKGTYYVDLSKTSNKQLKKAIKRKLRTAEGIVFDLRGYPNVAPGFLNHLTNKPITSARWMIPVFTVPESATTFDTTGRWNIKPKAPFLSGKIIFLTNEWAISYAESVMGIVEHYKLGEIVGKPTAGTNGNIVRVNVFAEFKMVFTGMKVLKHDGSQHHGVGILPTIPCEPTIEGIRQGRDEQLEKAISVIEEANK